MLPYIRLSPGPGFKLHRALLYYAQRFVTAPSARRAAASLIAAVVRRRQGGAYRAPLDAEDLKALAELRADGVAQLGAVADDPVFEQMSRYFLQRSAIGPDGVRRKLEEMPAGALSADYDLETVLGCPGLIELVNSPAVLRIAGAYLGCKPTLASLGVRWSFPARGSGPRYQDFHRDVDDWRFVKLFIYLTDVCSGSGPHVYVRGSHATGFGVLSKAYDLRELEARYGPDKVLTVTGPRGAAFMADTVGIHRGGRPLTRPRLLLQAQYSLLPVYAFDYEPVDVDAIQVDPYCNRLLMRPRARGAAPMTAV